MGANKLPKDVVGFILSHFDSVEQIEILLYLRSLSPFGAHAENINLALRTSLSSVEQRLDGMLRRNLVTEDQQEGVRTFFYAPSKERLAIVESFAAFYQTHRVAIIQTIYSQPTSALKCFSDAFRIKETE